MYIYESLGQKTKANATHSMSCKTIHTPISFMERCQQVAYQKEGD